MGHSYTSILFHCVFSTKERRPFIGPDLQSRLWPYLDGIARDNSMKALMVGGVEDHCHILVSLPSTLAIAKAIQLLKGGSSLWVRETFPPQSDFAWQEGYGAFSLGVSQVESSKSYIESQPEHHRKTTFKEEFLAFLKKHNLEYDERFIWGQEGGSFVPPGLPRVHCPGLSQD